MGGPSVTSDAGPAATASGHGALAYRLLREAIVAAELEPGRRLSEQELGARLGFSRTPVREALLRLRDERLVTVVPQSGTYVAPISSNAVRDAQFVREALECAAVRLAAVRATPGDVSALRGVLRHQEKVRDAADHARFHHLDNEFHAGLCELSGHGIAWALVQRANGHLDRVRRLSLPQPRFLAEMVAEHHAVLDAVAAKDADRAERALRHHLRMVLSELPALRNQHPDFFEST